MRIVTYNIHSGIGVDKVQSYKRIGRLLAQQNIDIALIQEMDTRPAERAIQDDIEDLCSDHFCALIQSPALQEKNGWYGNAVLTRYPILSKRTLDVSQVGFQPRNIQEVIVETELGPLRVINTHKGLKKHERRKQFALLVDYLRQSKRESSLPILLGGDFNEWQFFTTAFREINHVLTEHKTNATFPTAWPLFKLDRIWTSFPARMARAKVLRTSHTRYYSDHYPILLDINVNKTSSITR